MAITLTPLVKFANLLGLPASARSLLAYNQIDFDCNGLSFLFRSRWWEEKMGKKGFVISTVLLAAAKGVMVASLGRLQKELFDTEGKKIPAPRQERLKVPTHFDSFITGDGRWAPRGGGQTLLQMIATMLFAGVNIASKIPALNREDEWGDKLDPNDQKRTTGDVLGYIGALIGVGMSANESAGHKFYERDVTEADYAEARAAPKGNPKLRTAAAVT